MRAVDSPDPARPGPSRRAPRVVLALALAATVVAAWWPLPSGGDSVASVAAAPMRPDAGLHAAAPRGAPLAVPAAAPGRGASALPDRSDYAQVQVLRDPFSEPPPPAPRPDPARSGPKVPPPVPAVPWTYAGRLDVPGQTPAVLLNDGARTLVLPVGATLGDWRLEADPPGRLEFIHLPSGTPVAVQLPN